MPGFKLIGESKCAQRAEDGVNADAWRD